MFRSFSFQDALRNGGILITSHKLTSYKLFAHRAKTVRIPRKLQYLVDNMNWFKNIFSSKATIPAVEKKSSASFLSKNGLLSISSEDNLAKEGYILNSSVNASINKIIKAVVQMRLVVVDKNDEEQEPISNKLSHLLNNPDGHQGQSQWLEEYFGYYLTFGNSFIYRVAPEHGVNAGRAMSLKVLSERQINIITKETVLGTVIHRYEFSNNNNMVINHDDLLHGKTFNPQNQAVGLSPIMACGLSVDLDNEAKRWNVSLLQNGVNPSGVYTVEGELTEQQFRRMQNQMGLNSGGDHAGEQKLLEGGTKFQQTGLSPKDADFSNGQILAKREIASVFNIAPQLIGDTASQTFANYEQAILSLHNDTAFPLLEALVEQLNNWLAPSFGDNLMIKIDDSKVEALVEQKHRRWDAIDKSNEMSTNEKRKAKGFDKLEDEAQGDAVIINGSSTLDSLVLPTVTPEAISKPSAEDKTFKKFDKKEYLDIQVKSFNKAEEKSIKKSHKLLAEYFDDQFKEIFKNLKGITNTSEIMTAIEAVIKQTTPKLEDAYNTIYKDISFNGALKARKESAKSISESFETKGSHVFPFNILKDFKKEFGSYVDSYFVKINVVELIVAVNEATRKMVDSVVTAGVKEGASIFDISKSIQGLYDNDMELWRAERIARTETLRGMSYAQHESQLKVSPLSKQVWMDAGDDRVRPTSKKGKFNHRNADFANGKIGLDEAFKVSGQNLRFPRDTSLGATAGNVINCRCSVAYIDEEFEEFFE